MFVYQPVMVLVLTNGTYCVNIKDINVFIVTSSDAVNYGKGVG
jgi:hypothetical protein